MLEVNKVEVQLALTFMDLDLKDSGDYCQAQHDVIEVLADSSLPQLDFPQPPPPFPKKQNKTGSRPNVNKKYI